MYDITVNRKKNRLYVSVGESNSTEMKLFLDKLEKACGNLLSGFTCIAEIPRDGSDRQEYQDLLFSTEDLILAYGVSKVVRVAHNRITSGMLNRDAWNSRSGYQVAHVATLNEAEKLLDN